MSLAHSAPIVPCCIALGPTASNILLPKIRPRFGSSPVTPSQKNEQHHQAMPLEYLRSDQPPAPILPTPPSLHLPLPAYKLYNHYPSPGLFLGLISLKIPLPRSPSMLSANTPELSDDERSGSTPRSANRRRSTRGTFSFSFSIPSPTTPPLLPNPRCRHHHCHHCHHPSVARSLALSLSHAHPLSVSERACHCLTRP